MEEIITHAMNEASANYESLLHSLNNYNELIKSNRAQLYPVDEMEEEISGMDATDDEGSAEMYPDSEN